MSTKYPNIKVRLVGEDGNAFSILGRTIRAMRMGGVSQDEIDAFRAEATGETTIISSSPSCLGSKPMSMASTTMTSWRNWTKRWSETRRGVVPETTE